MNKIHFLGRLSYALTRHTGRCVVTHQDKSQTR